MTHSPTSIQLKHRQRGFSMVEMLVAVVILGILAAIAAPSFQQMIVDTRMSTQANDFLTALNLTRSEAVKRNTRVTICPSSDGLGCAAAGDWNQGWIIFVDNATGAGTNAGAFDAGETILRVHGALSSGSTLVGDNDVDDYISYVSNGQARMADNSQQGGAVTLCNTQKLPGRTITITAGPGRPSVNAARPACP